MRGYLSNLISSQPGLSLGLTLGGIFLLVQWVITGLFIWRLPPEIPLWYSLPNGRLQLALNNWFWLLPGLSIAMSLINFILLQFGGAAVKIYASLQVWLTVVALFLMTAAMINIIRLAL